VPNFRLNQPITFKEGTGLTIDQNGIELYVRDHTGVVFSIGQAVGSGSTVQFNEVTSSKIIIDDSTLILSSNTITGSVTQTGNISVSDNLVISKDLTIGGILTAEKIETELTQSVTLFDSGSTIFGDTSDDTHQFSGSFLTSGSLKLATSISEISNDTSLTDSNASGIATENALKNYIDDSVEDEQPYLRKSFVHTGSFVSVSTSSFTATSASAPSGLTATSEEDFMFFVNGQMMEHDALTVAQSGSLFLLKIDNDSLGYDLESKDEVIAWGKFNS